MKIPFLQIEPTNLCNMNCVMCTRQNLERYGKMTIDGLQHIVGQVPGLKAVKLQGLGEPMLNPEIIPMMQYLRSRRIRVYTAINGTVLPENLDELMHAANRIEYSIDSLDPNEFKLIRGTADLEKVISNFRKLCSARKKRPKTIVSINSVLVRANDKGMDAIFRLAKETHADSINFNVVQNWTVSKSFSRRGQDRGSLSRQADMVMRMSRKYRIRAALHRPIAGYSECKWARIGSYITWDGFVTPCCQRPDPGELNFGNVFEISFNEIYNSQSYADLRAALINGEAPFECANCSVYTCRRRKNGLALSCRP
jgi:MoaA/NifB/PqqE/SkfB family radical SAM enzyme